MAITPSLNASSRCLFTGRILLGAPCDASGGARIHVTAILSPMHRSVPAIVCLLLGVAPASARADCPRHRVLWAVGEALAVNVLVNRWDAWGRNQPWAHVDPHSWGSNLRLGWNWDEDHFFTNMFSHPYHGGLYFNSGRDNCLSYWGA